MPSSRVEDIINYFQRTDLNLKNIEIIRAFENEFELFRKTESFESKWHHLERMHIIGQQSIGLHFSVHFMMLRQATDDKNSREFIGQVFRLFLILPGHIFGRLPIGNIGSTRVNAFQAMAIPEDLKKILNSEH